MEGHVDDVFEPHSEAQWLKVNLHLIRQGFDAYRYGTMIEGNIECLNKPHLF